MRLCSSPRASNRAGGRHRLLFKNRGGFLISNGEIWKNVRKIVYGLSSQTNYRRPSVGRMFNSVPSMTNIS